MITAFLVNYKRQGNLKQIVESILPNKNVEEIVIFNNDPDLKLAVDGATVINSEKNWKCWAKYVVPQLVKTKWVLILDDDLMLQENTINRFLEEANKDEEGIYGLLGLNLKDGLYSKGERFHTRDVKGSVKVDILLGRLVFCKPRKLSLASYYRSRIPN